MKRPMRRLSILLSAVAGAYLVAGLGLIAWPAPGPKAAAGTATTELGKFVTTGNRVEPASPAAFAARDGAKRLYRLYEGSGPDLMMLLHGSSADSRYLAGLARALSAASNLTVATLDLRGHGAEPGRRGDVDHVAQQEHDIADLFAALKGKRAIERFWLSGHSIGGGTAIRYAAGTQLPKPDGLVLLAPYIGQSAPSARADGGGWSTPAVTRFIGFAMMHRIGIHAFDGVPVVRFEVPARAKDGTETADYSWRLLASLVPRPDWRADILAIQCPVLVLAAEKDSIFRSEGYVEAFAPLKQANVEILPAIDHFQLATSDAVPQRMASWLGTLR